MLKEKHNFKSCIKKSLFTNSRVLQSESKDPQNDCHKILSISELQKIALHDSQK